MCKKFMRTIATVAMAAAVACGSAVPAFAYTDENAAVVVEEDIEETEASETETPDTEESSGVITPDGNLSLVDDLNKDEATGLQFMTVTTKDGHYFYIVIDRNGNSENVYFLNMVDEADLMELMSDEEKARLEGNEETSSTQILPVEDNTEEEATETDEDQNQSADKKDNGVASSLTMLGFFGLIGAGIAAAYYFLKVKPNKGRSGIDEDREFYDDEEYENEDEVEGNEGEEDDE